MLYYVAICVNLVIKIAKYEKKGKGRISYSDFNVNVFDNSNNYS